MALRYPAFAVGPAWLASILSVVIPWAIGIGLAGAAVLGLGLSVKAHKRIDALERESATQTANILARFDSLDVKLDRLIAMRADRPQPTIPGRD